MTGWITLFQWASVLFAVMFWSYGEAKASEGAIEGKNRREILPLIHMGSLLSSWSKRKKAAENCQHICLAERSHFSLTESTDGVLARQAGRQAGPGCVGPMPAPPVWAQCRPRLGLALLTSWDKCYRTGSPSPGIIASIFIWTPWLCWAETDDLSPQKDGSPFVRRGGKRIGQRKWPVEKKESTWYFSSALFRPWFCRCTSPLMFPQLLPCVSARRKRHLVWRPPKTCPKLKRPWHKQSPMHLSQLTSAPAKLSCLDSVSTISLSHSLGKKGGGKLTERSSQLISFWTIWDLAFHPLLARFPPPPFIWAAAAVLRQLGWRRMGH